MIANRFSISNDVYAAEYLFSSSFLDVKQESVFKCWGDSWIRKRDELVILKKTKTLYSTQKRASFLKGKIIKTEQVKQCDV